MLKYNEKQRRWLRNNVKYNLYVAKQWAKMGYVIEQRPPPPPRPQPAGAPVVVHATVRTTTPPPLVAPTPHRPHIEPPTPREPTQPSLPTIFETETIDLPWPSHPAPDTPADDIYQTIYNLQTIMNIYTNNPNAITKQQFAGILAKAADSIKASMTSLNDTYEMYTIGYVDTLYDQNEMLVQQALRNKALEDSLQAQLHKSQQETSILKGQLEFQTQKFQQEKTQLLDSWNKEKQLLQEQWSKEKQAFINSVPVVQQEAAQLKLLNQDLNQKLQVLEREVKSSQIKWNQDKSTIVKLNAEIEKLHTNYKQELVNLNQQTINLRSDLDDKNEKYKELAQRYARSKSRATTRKQHIVSLEQERKHYSQNILTLQEELSNAKANATKMGDMYKEKQLEYETTERSLQASNQKYKQLELAYGTITKEYENHSKLYQTKIQDLEQNWERERQQWNAKLQEAQITLNEKTTAYNLLQNQLDHTTKSMSAETVTLAESLKRVQQQTEDLNKGWKQNWEKAMLEANSNYQKSHLAAMTEVNNTFAMKEDKYNRQIAALNEKIADKTQAHDLDLVRLNSDINSLRSTLSTLEHEKQQLWDKHQKTVNDLTNLTYEMQQVKYLAADMELKKGSELQKVKTDQQFVINQLKINRKHLLTEFSREGFKFDDFIKQISEDMLLREELVDIHDALQQTVKTVTAAKDLEIIRMKKLQKVSLDQAKRYAAKAILDMSKLARIPAKQPTYATFKPGSRTDDDVPTPRETTQLERDMIRRLRNETIAEEAITMEFEKYANRITPLSFGGAFKRPIEPAREETILPEYNKEKFVVPIEDSNDLAALLRPKKGKKSKTVTELKKVYKIPGAELETDLTVPNVPITVNQLRTPGTKLPKSKK